MENGAKFKTRMHKLPEKQTIIYIHPLAPKKPPLGQSCNGCGVCCAVTTCPLAKIFIWQWRGACRALLWDEGAQRYQCGLLQSPRIFLPYLPQMWENSFKRYTRRMIAAGIACDSEVEV